MSSAINNLDRHHVQYILISRVQSFFFQLRRYTCGRVQSAPLPPMGACAAKDDAADLAAAEEAENTRLAEIAAAERKAAAEEAENAWRLAAEREEAKRVFERDKITVVVKSLDGSADEVDTRAGC